MALPTSLKFRSVVRFPAQVVGTTGVSVSIANGIYTFQHTIASFTEKTSIAAADRDNLFVALYDSDASTFRKVTLDTWLTSVVAGLDPTLTAIAATAPVANQGIYFTGADVAVTYSLTSLGRAISGLSTLTAHGVLVGNGASAPAALSVGATKSVLQGATGADPAFTTTPTVAALTVNANTASLPAPPSGTLLQVGGADSTNTTAIYDAFGTGSFTAGVQFRKARNTAAAPQALAADDVIGGTYAFGYGATGYSATQRGFNGYFAAEAWSDTAQGSYYAIYVTATGGTTSAEKFRVQPDGSIRIGTQTAPSTPAANKVVIYADSTSKNLKMINDAGTAATMVVADTGAANNFLTAISANGVISKAQPSAASLSDTVAPTTWTPAISFGGATTGITYSQQAGTYYRVGKLVIATAYIILTSKGSATGTANITGFPVASNSTANTIPTGVGAYYTGMASVTGGVLLRMGANSTAAILSTPGATGTTDLADTNFTNTTNLIVQIVYMVN